MAGENKAKESAKIDKNKSRKCEIKGKPTKIGSGTKERNEGGNERKCYKCSEMGHLSRDCSKEDADKCFKCGERGHWARSCSEKGGERCFDCKLEGHKRWECKEGMVCYNCHRNGHFSSECPEPRKIRKKGRKEIQRGNPKEGNGKIKADHKTGMEPKGKVKPIQTEQSKMPRRQANLTRVVGWNDTKKDQSSRIKHSSMAQVTPKQIQHARGNEKVTTGKKSRSAATLDTGPRSGRANLKNW